MGISWAECCKDCLPKDPSLHTFYISPSNQRRPDSRESGSAKTRLGTTLSTFFLWLPGEIDYH
uniref:Uncharacterized protein n=1 Tax=Phtheirospermum japonicum TaxID=374723 RepID=A0A830D4B4_9LAMI